MLASVRSKRKNHVVHKHDAGWFALSVSERQRHGFVGHVHLAHRDKLVDNKNDGMYSCAWVEVYEYSQHVKFRYQ